MKILFSCIVLSCLICSCTSNNDTEKPLVEKKTIVTEDTRVKEFLDMTDKCIIGDMSYNKKLIELYTSSAKRKNSNFLLYEDKNITRQYEKCAQKALTLNDPSLFENLISKPNQCANIAQSYYARGDLVNGAFWVQRVVNLLGEKDGFELLGRIFVKYKSTLNLGARMLSYSAYLGNTDAHDLLLSLTDPYSVYYQNIKD